MPASLKYTWEESDELIKVIIPFKGRAFNKTDVYCSDCLIKVSYSPFFLQLDLLDFVIPTSLQVGKKSDDLIIHVTKVSKGKIWNKLTFDHGTKVEINERRKESMERRTLELQRLHEESKERKIEEGREMLRDQMALDKAEMDQIDQLKKEDKCNAEDAVYETMSNLPSRLDPQSEPLFSLKEEVEDVQSHRDTKISSSKGKLASVRAPVIVKFKHKHRAFKTPRRESTQLREEAFLAKNRPYLKSNQYFNSESSDLAETDPTWLKQKGDEYFKAGDYLSAINVFSTIIDKDPTFLRAYTNRSACYLLIEEPGHCIHDCSEALKIIESSAQKFDDRENCATLKRMHVKIMFRLASAYCQFDTLRHYKFALGHLKDALNIDKSVDNSGNNISNDIHRLENLIRAHEYKRDGDLKLGENKLDAAVDFYTKAISKEKSFLKAYSNRSAAYLLLGMYEDCIRDSSFVLDTLKSTKKISTLDIPRSTTFGNIPPAGTVTRKNLVRTCLQRRLFANKRKNEHDQVSKDSATLEQYFGGDDTP